MTALVTLDELDFQLRLDLARDGEGEIEDEMAEHFEGLAERATALVLRHVKRTDDPWDIEEIPADAKHAILMVARNMWDEVDEPISPAVVAVLRPYRDPTLS